MERHFWLTEEEYVILGKNHSQIDCLPKTGDLFSLSMATTPPRTGKKRITLHDVIAHIENMGQRLEHRIDSLEIRLNRFEIRLDGIDRRLNEMEQRLTARMDALEEDLTATMKDVFLIQKRVGLRR